MERNKNEIKKQDLKCIFNKKKNAKAIVHHANDSFYILSDVDDVYDFKVITLSD